MAYRPDIPKIIFALCTFYLCMIVPVKDHGQAYAQSCETSYEVVLRLREPSIGSYSVWDTSYGGAMGSERFIGGAVLESGNVVLAAQSEGPFQTYQGEILKDGNRLVLVKLDRRGRVLWEQVHQIPRLKAVKSFASMGDQFFIAADQEGTRSRGTVWLGMFDEEGKKQRHVTLKERGMSLSASDIIVSHQGNNLMLAAAAIDPAAITPDYGVVMRLNERGAVLSKRAYRPGPDSAILGLSHGGAGSYIATGWMKNEQGGQDGWIMGLDEDSTIIWQKTIPRGRFAHIHDAVQVRFDKVMAVGTVISARADQQAGWLFAINPGIGEIVWQRYYTDEHKMSGRAIMAHDDNQYSVLLDTAEPVDEDYDEFTRLLSVNERGTILSVQNYFQGRGAHGVTLFPGYNRERMIAGYADIAYRDGEDELGEPKMRLSTDGWLIAAPSVMPYRDPCLPDFYQ